MTTTAESMKSAISAVDWERWWRVCLLATAYALAGRLGLSLAHFQDNATLIWAPTGMALAALVLFGQRLWPGVFLGALLVNLSVGTGWLPTLGISVGNTLEASLGVWLLARVGFRPNLERVRDVAAFAAFGVLGCTLVSATVGVGTLFATGTVAAADFGLVWLIWWLGDVGGAVVVAPPLLVGLRGSPAWSRLLATREAWGVLLALVCAAFAAFGGVLEGSSALLAAFAPFVFLIWAGGRLGPRGAVVASLVTSIVAAVGTVSGHGPFIFEETHTQLVLLWAYCAMMGAAGVTLAAAIAEREHAERRHLREADARRQLESKVEHAQRLDSLGLLAGGIAHDFNNILGAIRANAELLDMTGPTGREQREMLQEIQDASDRAAALCERLLTYAGRSVPSLGPVSLPELITELRVLLKAALPKKVALQQSLAPDLPPIYGDASKLGQVLMNLVLNGAEAIGAREGSVYVSAHMVDLTGEQFWEGMELDEPSPGSRICIEIRDTGAGMSPERVDRIFEPFYTTKEKGRGLGLAMVLGIIQGHGGAIEVDSEVGVGTTFRLYLSVCDDRVAQVDLHEPHATHERSCRKLLIADDERGIRRALARFMQQSNVEVVLCRDGSEAVEAFMRDRDATDAVLLDVTMPRMSGIEAMEAIRNIDDSVPIILMTGYSDVPLGPIEPTDIVRKPFVAGQLLALIRRHVADRVEQRV